MKHIKLSVLRKLAAFCIMVLIETLLVFAVFHVCKEWLHVTSLFIKLFISLVVATPVGVLVYKAIAESWTGEKIE